MKPNSASNTPPPPSAPAPAIRIRDVRVTLGENPVLRGVSLDIPAGRLVALIGPNGSGKTTLLRALLGLQPIHSGSIELFGAPLSSSTLKRVGYVPQKLSLDPSFVLSVREFLALRLPAAQRWFWQPFSTTDRQLNEHLPDLDIDRLLNRPIAGLSGGQLQRVLIAASLLQKPDLLLLDEPTAGIDTPGELTFYETIAAIHRRHQLTVVLVSHDLSMVCRHASWIYALNGVICCEGSPEEVMNAESLRKAYGIHVTPYHHHHHLPQGPNAPIHFHGR